jgi:16S rRNA (uracil1498-N3)-methyltransferase
MRIPRFYIPKIEEKKVTIADHEFHHLKNVLRLKQNCKIILFDGKGKSVMAKINAIHKDSADVEILYTISKHTSKIHVACACAIPKGKRLNFMFQKLSELGLDLFIPVHFKRSVAKFSTNKKEKLERIAIQSAKQCKREYLCAIHREVSVNQLVDMFGFYRKCILLDPYADTKIIDTVGEDTTSIIYIVGPEGGLSETERKFILSKEAIAVKFGSLILRTETAAIAVMSLLAALLQ